MRGKRPNRAVIAIGAVVVVLLALVVVFAGGRFKLFGSAVPLHRDFPVITSNMMVAETGPKINAPAWQPISVAAGTCTNSTLYHSDQSGVWNIYRLGDVAGSPNADPNITHGKGTDVADISPSRSPDGRWVAFSSNRDGNWEIYVASIDGSTQRRVTYNNTAADISPMWSPDGKAVVYETTRHGSRDLYMIDVTTGTEKRLTNGPGNEVNAFWSPDSKKIIYQSDNEGLWQIFQLDVTTGEQVNLSDGKGNDYNPQFSADGKMIAFRSYRDNSSNNAVVFVMAAAGGDVRYLRREG